MTDLRQGRDASSHDDGLLLAIEDLLDGNGVRCASVDNAFIIFHCVRRRPARQTQIKIHR
jgi:hypothetical protein